MTRTAALFCIGLLLALAALVVVPTGIDTEPARLQRTAVDLSVPPSAEGTVRTPRAIDFLELVAGSLDATEVAALEALAAAADRETLEAVAAQVAALPKLRSRAIALEVLLARYAELDARAATALAIELDLDGAAITASRGARARREAQTALDNSRVDAAAAEAVAAPQAAIANALLLPERAKAAALARIAVEWARTDVHGALAHFGDIRDEEVRDELTIAALNEWATSDLDAMLAYVQELPTDEREGAVRAALRTFAILDPTRALDAADAVAGELGSVLRRAALLSLARDEPFAALSRAEALPPSSERDQLIGAIAHAYGRSDPAAAVAWAHDSPDVLARVVSGVARVDPERAIELAFMLPARQDRQRLLQTLVASGVLSASHTAAVASRLLEEPNSTPALGVFVGAWAQRSPADALPWLLANRRNAATSAIAAAGASLARTNPAAAVAYFGEIPHELRANWIGAVADGYAQNDARAAAGWLEQYRDEPGYDAALAAVAARTAVEDPATAARMFAAVDLSSAGDATSSARAIAASWAKRDARAAAQWASGLRDATIAAGAAGAVARQWVASDAAEARAWAIGLAADSARDAALVQILGATAGTQAYDAAVLDAFSSGAARQAGVNEAVRIVATRDAAAARQLADRYLTDLGMRKAAERFISGRNSLAER